MRLVGNPEDWGFILHFLDETDPRPAREQFNEKYMGGWRHFPGGRLDPVRLTYHWPGDPPLAPISRLLFKNEIILLYPHAIVIIVQADGSWESCRMD